MSKQNERNERIGVEFTTKEGYQVIVIDYQDCMKVQVMFLDEHKWTTWTQWQKLKQGVLKNPFHPSICGIGYLGVDKNNEKPKVYTNGKTTREYTVWSSMIARCYNDKFHEENPTYKKCEVCERWKCYAYFLEDLPKIKNYELWRDNPNSGISLNKDIYYTELGIETDCKEYSLETVRFITRPENTKEMRKRK